MLFCSKKTCFFVFWRSFGAVVTAENHCQQGSSGKYVKNKSWRKNNLFPAEQKNSTFAPTFKPV